MQSQRALIRSLSFMLIILSLITPPELHIFIIIIIIVPPRELFTVIPIILVHHRRHIILLEPVIPILLLRLLLLIYVQRSLCSVQGLINFSTVVCNLSMVFFYIAFSAIQV